LQKWFKMAHMEGAIMQKQNRNLISDTSDFRLFVKPKTAAVQFPK
jgi:hypothetical protein